jgi:hypothetical protein
MEWYDYFSDSTINEAITILVRDYKVVTTLFIGPLVVWAVRKWTDWTPWPNDNKIADIVEERLGMK